MTITRQQLQLINRKRLRYPLDIAEKDYYLALAVQRIAGSELGATLVFKGGTAWYPGILEQPGAIKVEIDRMQSVVLPTCQQPYINVWGQDFSANVMDIREICAEKCGPPARERATGISTICI